MPKATKPTYIPLVCNLCPKCPQFSDLSHLLTHVSSKSHLACKFQKSILAGQDQEAANQLRHYERWYQQNNIAGLLADRMNVKENKKTGGSRKSRIENAQPKREDMAIKSENIHPALYNLPATQVYRAPMPPMQAPGGQWQGYTRFESTPVSSEFGGDGASDTPSMSNNIPNFRTRGVAQHSKRKAAITAAKQVQAVLNIKDPMLRLNRGISQGSLMNEQEDEEDDDQTHNVLPAAQLKGVIWPGMAIFDSATKAMQKRRNQKKDGSILAQMKITSLTTQPLEVIYNHDFSFRREKPIFGEGDDEDEGLTVVLTPPKRRSRARAPMRKVDSNAQRVRKQSPKGPALRARGRSTKMNDENSHVNHNFPSRSTSAHTTGSTRTYEAPSIDGEDEFFPRNIRGPVKQSKMFKVFRDEDQGDRNSPARTESSLQESRYDEYQQEYYQQAPVRYASPNFAHHSTQANPRGMSYGVEPQKDGMDHEHLFVTERDTLGQYGGHLHPGPAFAPYTGPSLAPGAGRQYFHEPPTINPLRAQIQQALPVFQSQAYFQDPYPYALQNHHTNGYLGHFKPMDVNPDFPSTPPPAFLCGGPGPLNPHKPGVDENGGNEGYGLAKD